MLSNWLFTSMGYVEVLGQIVVLASILYARQLRRWPSLFAACLTHLFAYVVLLFLLRPGHSYAAYFYVYWGNIALQAIIRLWMVVDVLRSIPGIEVIPLRIGMVVTSTGAALAFAAARISFQDGIHFGPGLAASAMLFDRCVNISWGVFFVVTLLVIKLSHLGWDAAGAYITNGILFHVGILLTVSVVYSFGTKPYRIFFNHLQTVGYIAVLTFWTLCFTRVIEHKPTPLPKNSPDNEEITLAIMTLIRSQRN